MTNGDAIFPLQAAEGVYSTVDEPLSAPMVHHRDQQRPLQVGCTTTTLLPLQQSHNLNKVLVQRQT